MKRRDVKATKTKPRKKAVKPRRKRGMKLFEMWVLAATLLLVVYLVTQVKTPDGMSFMTVIIEEVSHEGN